MDFAFSEEQQMLRAAARDYLADRWPVDRVASVSDSEAGWDPSSWVEFRDMGWLDPDLGVLEHAVLAEELGYVLYPGPWWATVGLCGVLRSGDSPATLAFAETGGLSLRSSPAMRAESDRLTGRKLLVPDAQCAEEFLVTTDDGIYRVDAGATGVRVEPRSTTDRSRRLSEVVFDGSPGERVADVDAAGGIRNNALALLSCEAVGVAQRCLDIAAEHARNREQFGRPIGSYQGVSHRLANSYIAVQLARSLAYWAAWTVSENDVEVDRAVTAAITTAAEAAVLSAENAIQVMGGIGFTWDHPLQRFYKRAQWTAHFDATPTAHRAELAGTLLD